MIVKCKKSLYKSTYKSYAFILGDTYELIDENEDFFFIIDNLGCLTNFHKKSNSNIYYNYNEYFVEIQTDFKSNKSFLDKLKQFIHKF